MKHFKVALVALDGQELPSWVPEQMERAGITFVSGECETRTDLTRLAGDADVVWVFGGSRIVSADNLAVVPRCGAIIRTGSGTDNIPVTAATAAGIVVANTPSALSDAVADHAIGLLFAVTRRIAVQDRAVRRGVWDRQVAWPDWHLRGNTLGFVGFGMIAQLIARKMIGFELALLAYDPFQSAAAMSNHGVHKASLEDVLTHADFISIHCPLTAETHHLIGERELRRMKPTAILINTSRGPVVDEEALTRALVEGTIGGAGLDVLEHEPPDLQSPLLGLDNVVLTPHIAGYSDEFPESLWRLSVETAIDLSKGKWPRSYVNREVKPRWRLA